MNKKARVCPAADKPGILSAAGRNAVIAALAASLVLGTSAVFAQPAIQQKQIIEKHPQQEARGHDRYGNGGRGHDARHDDRRHDGRHDDRGRGNAHRWHGSRAHAPARPPAHFHGPARVHGPSHVHVYRGAGPPRDLHRGARLPSHYHHARYYVDDWRAHRLSPPPHGHRWVRIDGDYVLVAVATGIIAHLLLAH